MKVGVVTPEEVIAFLPAFILLCAGGPSQNVPERLLWRAPLIEHLQMGCQDDHPFHGRTGPLRLADLFACAHLSPRLIDFTSLDIL